jgi:hypothetical protein
LLAEGARRVNVYDLIREATLRRRQVLATYNGRRRELCPHLFQFAGETSSMLPPGGAWRCIPVDELVMFSFAMGRGTRARVTSARSGAWTSSTSRRRPIDANPQASGTLRGFDSRRLHEIAISRESAETVRLIPGVSGATP